MTEIDRGYTIGPDGSRVRKLFKPIEGHDGKIDTIILRRPKHREVMTWGDPAALIVMRDAMLPHEDMGIVASYLDALCGDATGKKLDPALLDQLDYIDTLALKDAVISFFKAAEALITSSAAPTN